MINFERLKKMTEEAYVFESEIFEALPELIRLAEAGQKLREAMEEVELGEHGTAGKFYNALEAYDAMAAGDLTTKVVS